MRTKLVAAGGRTRTVAALVALVAAAVTLTVVAPAPAQAAATQTPVLAQGAGMGARPSAAVRRVQRVLHDHGYSLGRPGVDGRFGPITARAVRALQSDYGLAVDGIVGPKTRKLVRLVRSRAPQRGAGTGKPNTPKRSTAPQPSPQQSPAPAPRQTTQPAPSSGNGTDLTGWVALALAIALAALGAALWAGTRRAQARAPEPEPAPVPAAAAAQVEAANAPEAPAAAEATPSQAPPALTPLTQELYLEGRSADDHIGAFRGNAIAATLSGPAGTPPAQEATWYLVDDLRKGAPVWVRGADVQRSPSKLAAGEPVIGYVTVSAEGPRTEADGAIRKIEDMCDSASWELSEVVTDREAGRGLERPGLGYALEQIAKGQARGLVVGDLRRVCRSIVDLATLMEWFRDAQAALVALDLGVDTSTPAGQQVAGSIITLGGWERERAARRARSGLTEVSAGARQTGRPALSDRPELVERIAAMRAANMTLQAIADQLNAEGVPTIRGGAMWRPSSVQSALRHRRPGTRGTSPQLPSLEDRG